MPLFFCSCGRLSVRHGTPAPLFFVTPIVLSSRPCNCGPPQLQAEGSGFLLVSGPGGAQHRVDPVESRGRQAQKYAGVPHPSGLRVRGFRFAVRFASAVRIFPQRVDADQTHFTFRVMRGAQVLTFWNLGLAFCRSLPDTVHLYQVPLPGCRIPCGVQGADFRLMGCIFFVWSVPGRWRTHKGAADPAKLLNPIALKAEAAGLIGALAGPLSLKIPFDPGMGSISYFTAAAYGLGRAVSAGRAVMGILVIGANAVGDTLAVASAATGGLVLGSAFNCFRWEFQ